MTQSPEKKLYNDYDDEAEETIPKTVNSHVFCLLKRVDPMKYLRWKKFILLHCSFTKNSFRSRAAGEKYLHKKRKNENISFTFTLYNGKYFLLVVDELCFSHNTRLRRNRERGRETPKKFSFRYLHEPHKILMYHSRLESSVNKNSLLALVCL